MLKYSHLKIFKKIKLTLTKITKSTKIKQPKLVNKNVEKKSTKIINLAGYVILLLAILDYAFLLIPANFFEPSWAYNIAGNLVENVWAFLLGFLLIFYRRDQGLILPQEFTFLSLLSWLALMIGIGYFLIIPLIIGNTFRLSRAQQAQVIMQLQQQNFQVQRYSQQLNEVSPEQLNNLWQNYQQQASEQKLPSVEDFKENLLTEVKQKQETAKKQLQTRANQQKINLFKNSVKWSLGAIISGISFILIWRYTKWTRAGY